jgi:60 kDa SS-A/Ro ribonucleoprotein
MSSVLRTVGTRVTPQTEPVIGKPMVENSAGGYTFQLDDFARLHRFLILGVDEGTYYSSARALAVENATVVLRCLDADPKRTVEIICQVSDSGRAPKNDPALFALAMATAHPEASKYALASLHQVARTGTHLFHFAQFVEAQRGWGRGLRRAVADWYQGGADGLAYQLIKYRQRDGWTHRDLLRLSHPKAPSQVHKSLYDFACGRLSDDVPEGFPRIIDGFEMVQRADAKRAAELIHEYRLPWEALTSEQLAKPEPWAALLESGSLPLGALVRNLGVMTTRGVLAPLSKGTTVALKRLGDVEEIRRARLHPIAILNALITYQGGRSRGGVEWTPVPQIVDALDAAFYSSFGVVEPAGKRTVLGLDVSGSMTMGAVANAAFTSMQGATAMAMVTAAAEPQTIPVAFSHTMVPVDVSPRRRLDDQMRDLNKIPFGRTDCAQPMLWAMANKVEADTFVIYTDNETYCGSVHPFQALQQYRQKMGINARLVVVGMTATGFTIADPQDVGMLDVVGFDTTAPQVISDFSAGRI